MFKPRFGYTHQMVKLLLRIEQARALVEYIAVPPDLIQTMRREAKVKSVRYSTGIEGNPLSLLEVQAVIQKPRGCKGSAAQQEVRNYWNCLTFIDKAQRRHVPPNEAFIRRLHAMIAVRNAGRRQKSSAYRGSMPPGMLFAVRDSETGAIEYIPPCYEDVPPLMRGFSAWLVSDASGQLPTPIRAAIAEWQLLTIHPFSDGNGRTARALATYLLAADGYDLKGLYSLEEYHWRDLPRYYSSLQMNLLPHYYDGRNDPPDLAPWIIYFLETMTQACEQVISTLARGRPGLASGAK
ncbi:Fic family protein [Heliophilum fasciatum]|uniref:Fic family protein n=1 Tax=Heliophilum fasciatum TaxID=35700 RepID=A0A4R2S7Z6_9FIRM|nr:Fic family protein [Heliophilum fasciatum]MCW2276943.1 Fic family protein [Heliophilum fasciatum]TCP68531.1 Fic family protein [Heliophilum fasciatum]